MFVCDACNSFKVSPQHAPEEAILEPGLMLRDPFQFKGSLIVTSSDFGQASLATPDGSLFTLTFLHHFEGEWVKALVDTRKDISTMHTVAWEGSLEPDDLGALDMPLDIGEFTLTEHTC